MGRKKLQVAMDACADTYNFEVTWLPFLLRPDTPLEGTPKAPNTPDNPRVGARLRQVGEENGINFTGLCDAYPNTVRAHLLTEMALDSGKQDAVATKCLQAYFTDGEDVNDIDNLVKWGTELAGLNEDKIRIAMKDQDLFEKTKRTIVEQQRSQGVSGVPYFFFNGQPGFSGAQDPATFIRVFKQVAGK